MTTCSKIKILHTWQVLTVSRHALLKDGDISLVCQHLCMTGPVMRALSHTIRLPWSMKDYFSIRCFSWASGATPTSVPQEHCPWKPLSKSNLTSFCLTPAWVSTLQLPVATVRKQLDWQQMWVRDSNTRTPKCKVKYTQLRQTGVPFSTVLCSQGLFSASAAKSCVLAGVWAVTSACQLHKATVNHRWERWGST